ncbi:MAG: hypothetical protein KAT79_07500, partial [candidate division Zixibacteria bacterium]|nr:hypothetical protein [candidate division Zixibacteria bacterium]
LWSRPFNDFQRSYLFPAIFSEGLHTVILWGSLMGLLLLIAARPREVVWLALLIGYYAFIHIVLHSISRYNFNAMPFVIIAAAYLGASVAETFRGTDKASKRNLLLGLLLMISVWPLNAGYINAILGCGLSSSIVLAVVAFKTILIVCGLSLVGRTLMESSSRLARLALPVVGGFVFLVCAWASPLAQDRWAEFSCRLDEPRLKSGTRIYLSSMPPVREGERVAALLDIKSGAGRKNSFAVTVADTTMRFVGGKGQLFDYFYPKPTYDIYSDLIPIGIEEFRQWAIIPLPDSLLAASVRRNGFVDISVAIDARIAEENNFIDLYGNFDHAEDGIHIPGIRFTSIERYVFEDDPRVRYFVKSLSDSAKSYYIPRNETSAVSSEDLSPSTGRQTGRYNIFLVHFKPDGSFDVY